MRSMRTLAVALAVCAGAALPAAYAGAETAASAPSTRNDPRRTILLELSRPLTVEFEATRLADVFAYIASSTGADLQVYDLDEDPDAGFDPETPVTLKVENQPALTVIERVLAKLNRSPDTISAYTWQFSEDGLFEVGSRSALNRHTRVELYDIHDLLFVIPTFDNAPEFDLGSILSQSGQRGGGGGQSPFTGGTEDPERESPADRAAKIMRLIQNNVEPNEWIELGGDAASIEYYDGNLVVTAPDYIHRQIDGYKFWPRSLHRFGTRGARRFVEVVPAPPRKAP